MRAEAARKKNLAEEAEIRAKYGRKGDTRSKLSRLKLRPRTHRRLGTRTKEAAKKLFNEARDFGQRLARFRRDPAQLPRRSRNVAEYVLPGVDTRPVRPYSGRPLTSIRIGEVSSPRVIDLRKEPPPFKASPKATKGGNKVVANSFERYNGGARVKRAYGSSTVTRFYVYLARDKDNPAAWHKIEGYGKTPGERKTDAIRRAFPNGPPSE